MNNPRTGFPSEVVLSPALSEVSTNLFIPRSRRIVKSPNANFPEFSESAFEPGGGVWSEVRLKRIQSYLELHQIEDFLDVGCGDGSQTTDLLAQEGYRIVGLEPVENRAKALADKGVPTIIGTLEEYHKNGGPKVPNAVMFDSLQYSSNDRLTMAVARKILQPKGKIVLTVPCYPRLYSRYDLAIGNLRRYKPRAFLEMAEQSGFEVNNYEFLFSFLLPGLIIRKFLRGDAITQSNIQERLLNRASSMIHQLSNLEKMMRIPFGLSLLAVLSKR